MNNEITSTWELETRKMENLEQKMEIFEGEILVVAIPGNVKILAHMSIVNIEQKSWGKGTFWKIKNKREESRI